MRKIRFLTFGNYKKFILSYNKLFNKYSYNFLQSKQIPFSADMVLLVGSILIGNLVFGFVISLYLVNRLTIQTLVCNIANLMPIQL